MKARGFIGTYTKDAGGRAEGIYSFVLDPRTGAVEDVRLAARTSNPSYLALAPSGEFLYAVNELNGAEGPGGLVSAFRVDPDQGALELLNCQSSGGQSPCHITLGPCHITLGPYRSGPGPYFAVVSNYGDGVLAVLPLEFPGGGGLGEAVQLIRLSGSGPDRERQAGPHAHSFWFNPRRGFGLACDLGSDMLRVYTLPGQPRPLSGQARVLDLAASCPARPGAGPRHACFHPAGNRVYVLNELDATVDCFAFRADGSLVRRQTVPLLPPGVSLLPAGGPPLPAGVRGPYTGAALRLGGRFLYASIRGYDSIAVFGAGAGNGRLSGDAGRLEWLSSTASGGSSPRDICLDPSGEFLLAAHQDSDNITVFRLDRAQGRIRQMGSYPVPSPVSVVFQGLCAV